MGAGLAALVRGGAVGALLLLTMLLGHRFMLDYPLIAEALDQPLIYLPVLLVVARSLLVPAGLSFAAAFGLRPRPDGRRACVQATLVLIAAGIVTDILIGVFSERFGL